MTASPGRTIDHVVMPVDKLGASRALFSALGFTVAPDAAHPFGTGNACVFLADGTYIEPLAVLDRDLAETEGSAGNTFLRRDLAYRLRHSLPGFSGVAVRSDDAAADRETFVGAGYDGGDLLEFGRRFDGADGSTFELRFRLAFAADHALPDTFVFACERVAAFPPDRSELARHRNGVAGLARIVCSAAQLDTARRFLSKVFGCEPIVANSLGFSIAAGPVVVDVLDPDGMSARYGVAAASGAGLQIVGLVFRTMSLDPLRASARAEGLIAIELPGRLVLRLPAPSEAFLAFETMSDR